MLLADVSAGVVGAAQGRPPADCRPLHLHQRPAFQSHPPAPLRRLDVADQVPPAQGLGGVRVPGVLHPPPQPLHTPNGDR